MPNQEQVNAIVQRMVFDLRPSSIAALKEAFSLVGVTDGDKGDIVVASGGQSWQVKDGIVDTANLGGDITAAGKALLDDASATAQRATLGLVIGTNVQAQDAELQAIAGLTSAANKGIQFTGSGTAATYDLTAAGKALLDDADAAAQRATLGITSFTGVADDLQISVLKSTGTGLGTAGVQTWAGTNKTAQDVFTLAGSSTYFFNGYYALGSGGTPGVTLALAFALSGGATVSTIAYTTEAWQSVGANALGTEFARRRVDSVSSTVVTNGFSGSSDHHHVTFTGMIVTGSGGVITPQINYSSGVSASNTLTGSFVSFSLLGASGFSNTSGWA